MDDTYRDATTKMEELGVQEGVDVIPVCAQLESELSEMENEESNLYFEELDRYSIRLYLNYKLRKLLIFQIYCKCL